MKNFDKIYNSIVSKVTLLCYLLIFILNIFHFHKIDFKFFSTTQIVEDSKSQIVSSVDENKCIVNQNFNSLHSFTQLTASYIVSDLQKQLNLTFVIENSYINKFIYLQNHLRAPPLFS